jgi:DNA helicase IV
MAKHPELEQEQAYLDHAYACLEESRANVTLLRGHVESGRGGTFAARFERDVIEETVRGRLAELNLKDHSLIFGRIDRPDDHGLLEAFHIGRVAVADDEHNPVVVDWRAPIAEPFYRATGREPMGLVRRRHFVVKGARLVEMEDELFGEGHLGIGPDGMLSDSSHNLRGYGTLMAALDANRTGQLGDIVATIQVEQDEIIRSPGAGVLVVQGGPGTGKTVVALHRAAYLLYTHRFPLEDQGVMFIGPNRVFLRYIERVLPSLGEAGVEQVVPSDLVPGVRFGAIDNNLTARVKGDARMARLVAKAIVDRERGLRTDLVVPYGLSFLRVSAARTADIASAARRRFRRHNAARRHVEAELFEALARSSREDDSVDTVRDRVRHHEDVRRALERMWPVLTPAQLLHDLFGSRPLLKLAGGHLFDEAELEALYRPRAEHVGDVVWTDADVGLLDEALALLGPKPVKGKLLEADEIRTYGHIVIDEVQDLTPMQLRMAARRSLNGSMTVVGDIAQSTGPFAAQDWNDVLAHLPDRRPARVVELSVGYRIPSTVMELANKVLQVAAPQLRPPRAVRSGDDPPRIVAAAPGRLVDEVVAAVRDLTVRLDDAAIAVVCPASSVEEVATALTAADIAFTRAAERGLGAGVSVVPVGIVKGLELDAVVVVEPARIVASERQGLRALYVALTRSTKLLTIVHSEGLPEPLR